MPRTRRLRERGIQRRSVERPSMAVPGNFALRARLGVPRETSPFGLVWAFLAKLRPSGSFGRSSRNFALRARLGVPRNFALRARFPAFAGINWGTSTVVTQLSKLNRSPTYQTDRRGFEL